MMTSHNDKNCNDDNNGSIQFIPYSSALNRKWRTTTFLTNGSPTADVESSSRCDYKTPSLKYGLNAKQFHSVQARKKSCAGGSHKINQEEKTRKLLLHAKLRVDYNKLQRDFDSFERRTVCKFWPLQKPALEHLDELKKTDVKMNDNTNASLYRTESARTQRADDIGKLDSKATEDHPTNITVHSGQQSKHVIQEIGSFPNSPLWSFEPRIFAVETSSTGKRKYLVCHLGRFMHHYWKFCEPSAKHYYELIREGTPCRLYFGKKNKSILEAIKYSS